MAEITSFPDVASVVYLGHRASKSPRDSKIMRYNPRKRQKMALMASFADATRVVYRGSQGIEIHRGLENHGL